MRARDFVDLMCYSALAFFILALIGSMLLEACTSGV
jgi:hypothetical protein